MRRNWATPARSAGSNLMNEYSIPSVAEIKENGLRDGYKFNVVSLFAGGGGSSTGYRMACGNVLAVNEFIPEAIKSYRANWPDTKVMTEDVRKLTPEQILEVAGIGAGDLDILDGSPPCSAFSTAGSRAKGWGKSKAYSDSKQESVEDLFFEYIRILRGVQPKVFIAENVSGLAKGVAKGYLNEIMRELRLSGYNVTCKILDARWLGVPQSRTRTIFVGVRNDLWKEAYKGKLHPAPNSKFVTIREAFKGLKFTDDDRVETDMRKYATGRELARLPVGGQSKKYFQLVKAHPDGVSGCVTASSGNTGIACVKHWDNRAFTVSEVKRLMSIPDDYILTGTYQQKVERLGRMVAPFMMKAVAQNLVSMGVFNEAAK
jgi:DNA (cytosine-5)-methyltransferase 1